MSNIALISCVSKKLKNKTEAQNLYISPLFIKSKKFAQDNFDNFYILSAKYGLLPKNKVISDYNVTLNKMSKISKYKWSLHTARQINNTFSKNDKLYIMAGKNYYNDVIKYINIEYDILMEGMSIGKRLQWLSK